MSRRQAFRAALAAPEILVLPGAHDALAARLIAQAGFKAYTAGGYSATANLLGAPDTSQLTMSEMADFYARLGEASALPILADADTGYGNSTNVARAVRAYERAGVAALFIEDQVFPKRCGHMAGKAVIPLREMVEKLKAALDARQDPDLVIMARTDALAVKGLDDAIARAQAYRETGADLLFVEAPRSRAEMLRICDEIDGPCLANNIEGGLTTYLGAVELQEIGYAAVAFPVAATYAAARAFRALYGALLRDGSAATLADSMETFESFHGLIGLKDLRAREAAYQDFARELVGPGETRPKSETTTKGETS